MTVRAVTAVTITHPEKVLFPDDGITKGEVAAYYAAVADIMLPHVRGRPVTMERFPAGIDAKGFLQKNVVKGFPAWLQRAELPKKGGTVFYPLAEDARSLQWMANQNTVTLHVWPSRMPEPWQPDVCVFDLDPAHDDPAPLRRAALGLRDLLVELRLASVVKTSGSKGFHIVVPLVPTGAGAVSRFADAIAAQLIARIPDLVTQEFSKADRGGRILIDIGRNRPGATMAAAYTLRARSGAPVSAPCTWDEIESGAVGPQTFTLRTMAERLAAVGDLWHDLAGRAQRLPEMPGSAEEDAPAPAPRKRAAAPKRAQVTKRAPAGKRAPVRKRRGAGS
jgi:bifunctional non-homologous end joining protein LigD